MSIITWNSDLIIQIPQIDGEHQQLVALVNRFHEYMMLGLEQPILDQIMPELIAATRTHFTNEEDLMLQYKYPDTIVQHMIHQNLFAQIMHLNEKLRRGEMGLNPETLNFLIEWLNDHIRHDDRRFGDFLHTKGIA